MEEVFETGPTAGHWSDAEGNTLPIGEMKVEKDEILDPDVLTKCVPEEFEGYTGNEGMTLDRWYRHAAVFLWPERRHFEVLCGNGSQNAVPAFEQMVANRRKTKGAGAVALNARCVEFATAILAKWPEVPVSHTYDRSPRKPTCWRCSPQLDEPRLIRDFLERSWSRMRPPSPAIPWWPSARRPAGRLSNPSSWPSWRVRPERRWRGTFHSWSRSARPSQGRNRDGRTFANSSHEGLVPAIEAIDTATSSTDWQSRKVNRAKVSPVGQIAAGHRSANYCLGS